MIGMVFQATLGEAKPILEVSRLKVNQFGTDENRTAAEGVKTTENP
jgi:hypothetical protein